LFRTHSAIMWGSRGFRVVHKSYASRASCASSIRRWNPPTSISRTPPGPFPSSIAPFLYQRREVKGIQTPVETLRVGHGSCRDFAMLMIEAARSLGLAARFVSGYLAGPLKDPEEPPGGRARGSTHAWAQIYLPGAGWIDFDPSRGSVGKIGLVTVAVVRDPHHAIPLHGTFIGSSSDHLDMEVQVSITPGKPEAISATPRRSTDPQFGQPV